MQEKDVKWLFKYVAAICLAVGALVAVVIIAISQ